MVISHSVREEIFLPFPPIVTGILSSTKKPAYMYLPLERRGPGGNCRLPLRKRSGHLQALVAAAEQAQEPRRSTTTIPLSFTPLGTQDPELEDGFSRPE